MSSFKAAFKPLWLRSCYWTSGCSASCPSFSCCRDPEFLQGPGGGSRHPGEDNRERHGAGGAQRSQPHPEENLRGPLPHRGQAAERLCQAWPAEDEPCWWEVWPLRARDHLPRASRGRAARHGGAGHAGRLQTARPHHQARAGRRGRGGTGVMWLQLFQLGSSWAGDTHSCMCLFIYWAGFVSCDGFGVAVCSEVLVCLMILNGGVEE